MTILFLVLLPGACSKCCPQKRILPASWTLAFLAVLRRLEGRGPSCLGKSLICVSQKSVRTQLQAFLVCAHWAAGLGFEAPTTSLELLHSPLLITRSTLHHWILLLHLQRMLSLQTTDCIWLPCCCGPPSLPPSVLLRISHVDIV